MLNLSFSRTLGAAVIAVTALVGGNAKAEPTLALDPTVFNSGWTVDTTPFTAGSVTNGTYLDNGSVTYATSYGRTMSTVAPGILQVTRFLTATFDQPVDAFSFLWAWKSTGEDGYTLSIKTTNGSLDFEGPDFNAAGASVPSLSSGMRFYAFLAEAGEKITGFSLSGGSNGYVAAFDDVSLATRGTVAVPGPIAGAGLPALLGALGLALFRRRRVAA